MVINTIVIEKSTKPVTIDILPVKYLFIVKFTRKDGTENVCQIWTDTLNGYFDLHDYVDCEVIKCFTYVLNAEKEGWGFTPNYQGKRFN